MNISNDMQLAVHINQKSIVTGKNLIYNIINQDQSIDQVSRVWTVYSKATERRRGLKNTTVIENAPINLIPELKQYAQQCEQNIGNKHFPNVNIHLCGALLSKKRIKEPVIISKPQIPQVPSKTLEKSLEEMKLQLQSYQEQISKLTLALQTEVQRTQELEIEIRIVRSQQEILLNILKQLGAF